MNYQDDPYHDGLKKQYGRDRTEILLRGLEGRINLNQRLEEYLPGRAKSLQDIATKEAIVSNAIEALERLRESNPFDRAN